MSSTKSESGLANRCISKCIQSVGTRGFYDAFFELLKELGSIDQCVIFQLDRNDELSCLLCRNFRNEHVVKPVARSYVEEGFKSDPNLHLFRSIKSGDVKSIYFDDLVANMDPAYRDYYFNDLGLVDKISIMTASKEYRYYINLYRNRGRASFQSEETFAQSALDSVIASLVTKHYDLNQSLRDEGSLAFLTTRERDVCQGILQAKKSEEIAYELGISVNTVVTYRKRAYEKLGINSRRALFSLCATDK